MNGKSQKKLGEALVEKKLICPLDLEKALLEQAKTGEFLGRVLLKMGLITERNLVELLSEQFRLPWMSLEDKYIDFKLAKRFPPSLIFDCRCFPLAQDERSVTFAVTNPLDVWVREKAEEQARGLEVKLALVTESDMDDVINRYRRYMQAAIARLFTKE